jgi:LuxR family transcriptional activator of conjugal transfer of Ti plasmids
METEFRAMIDMVDAASDERMIKSAMKTFASALGFEHVAYLETDGTTVRTLNTYPEAWQGIYFQNRYSILDPVVTEAKRRMRIFTWSADQWPRRGSSELRRFRDQAIDHGIRSGVTIPIEGSFRAKIMLTFSSSEADADRSTCQHETKAAQAVLSVHYRLKSVGMGALQAPSKMLSPRELVCTNWLAKGKVAHEIADITGINARTVQHYLDSARSKLNAATQPHLVALAKDHGLV